MPLSPDEGNVASPACSPDGRSVFYVETDSVGGALMKVPTDGGKPQKFTDLLVISRIDISPDGSRIVFLTFQGDEVDPRMAIISAETGQTIQVTKFQKPPRETFRFSHDGKAVVYATREAGVDNLWWQPIDGSSGHKLTNSTPDNWL